MGVRGVGGSGRQKRVEVVKKAQKEAEERR